MAVLWLVVLPHVVRISKANRITTVSDFIGSRYGKSVFLSALITIVAVVGVIPYIGLQIKAIIKTFTIISGTETGSIAAGLVITVVLGLFAIIFGARSLVLSERHGGLVFAIAFESIVKLLASVSVGLFVTFVLFDGFGDIFARIEETAHSRLLYLETGGDTEYHEWFALIVVSMMAFMFLPRQFHMAVVENYDEAHIRKAAWLFPLYLLLINTFVMPIAFGGLLLGGSDLRADYFVLTVPLEHGQGLLSLFAFMGGVSAATGMVIVETLALSTMVMNSIIMPALIRSHEAPYEAPEFPAVALNIKRIVIIVMVFFGYLFAVSIGEYYSLVEIGLRSFEAVTLFAPAFFLGLYWKRGTKHGAIAGIVAGFVVWFYTLIFPAMMKAGLISDDIVADLTTLELLNPNKLFGVKGLGKWSHSLFWSMLFNVLFYIGVSVMTRQSKEEEIQALVFVESFEQAKDLPAGGSFTVRDIEGILSQFLGKAEAKEFIVKYLSDRGKDESTLNQRDLLELRHEAEGVLSGAIGSAMAAFIFENKIVLTEKERDEISESIKQISENLRYSRQELADANRQLSYLKEFSENIIESAPVGIVTVDALLGVMYWNREMENITGATKQEALHRSVLGLLPWIPRNAFIHPDQGELSLQSSQDQTFTVHISPFKDPSGGFVVIIEDITEKKQMEEQLQQTAKLASIGRLTAGMSHEICNPLASISSLVQELRALPFESTEDVSFTIQSLNAINGHIERIARIVRSFGDFARISPGGKVLCNIAEVLDRTVHLVKYDKRSKNVNFVTDIADIPEVRVNPDQMQQVFLNLMLNAIDAMSGEGVVSVSLKRNDDSVDISLADTGCGIDESLLPRVFDPFFTTKPLGKGTGLGLSICYGIIREHDGTISVKSRKNEGTTFVIRLPIAT